MRPARHRKSPALARNIELSIEESTELAETAHHAGIFEEYVRNSGSDANLCSREALVPRLVLRVPATGWRSVGSAPA